MEHEFNGECLMIPQPVRHNLFPKLDPLTRKLFDKYIAYQLDQREFIGVIDAAGVRNRLNTYGYSYNGLAAAKRHPNDRARIDHGSYRQIPDEHPDVSNYEWGGARIVDEWNPVQCQYHVHLFPVPDSAEVEIFGHYEVRPDLFRPSFSIQRKRVHYRPEWHEDYLLGIASDDIQNLVQ